MLLDPRVPRRKRIGFRTLFEDHLGHIMNYRTLRAIFKAISRMTSTVCHMLKLSGWSSRLGAGLVFILVSAWADERAGVAGHGYTKWAKGPPSDPSFFPLAVWLQAPANAERYRKAGFNTYVGLWRGPTEEQLATLEKAGLRLICHQNEVGLRHRDDSAIIGWMHGDEPDNAQSLGNGKGYGPPILPEKIVSDFKRIRAADPSRPVLLNLGQGVAFDNYIGRGVRRNHPEDYPEYIKGCDIACFDIYPVVHDNAAVAGKLEFVAQGVERLSQWSRREKIVWNCIECTHIGNAEKKASPQQVRSEVWMSLIHGSRGLIYFVHQFKPTEREAALLDDPEMLEAVTAINRQIHALAAVLNSASITNAVTVESSRADVPIAHMVKRHGGATYLFAAAMRNQATTAIFKLQTASKAQNARVLDESRTMPIQNRQFTDVFEPYAVHLYQIPD